MSMAKPNYSFEKRQRDLAKKKQQDEKRQKKAALKQSKNPTDPTPDASSDGTSPDKPV
jgi:hypothetical protein